MLNQALAQSGWSGSPVTSANWYELIQDRLLEIDWEQALADVAPFIIIGADKRFGLALKIHLPIFV